MKKFFAALVALVVAAPAAAQNVLPSANWGDMLYRGQTAWMTVPPANTPTDYTYLKSNGPNNAPTWHTWVYPSQTTNTILGNVAGVNAPPIPITPSQFLDVVAYDVLKPQADPGTILYRGIGALGWQKLSPGNPGQTLTTGGLTTPPYWSSAGAVSLDQICTVQGSVLYRDALAWVCLGPGNAAQVLSTQGIGANPVWTNLPFPTLTEPGGVLAAAAATANQFVTHVNTSGVLVTAQPTFSNFSGALLCSQLPSLTGDISSSAGSCTTSYNGVVPLNKGGLGAILSAPVADRIFFYDQSAGSTAFLATGNTLAITGTTIDVVAASTTQAGAIEIATSAEVQARTATNLAMTPAAWAAASRELLLAPRTYYIRTDGNDTSCNGLSNAGVGAAPNCAFRTIQKAVNTVNLTLDTGGYPVTIKVALTGAYNAAVVVDRPMVGGGNLLIEGDVTTPTNVTISLSGSNAFTFTGGAYVTVRGFYVTTSGAFTHAFYATEQAFVYFEKMNFGPCTQGHMAAENATIRAILGSTYTISGGGIFHAHSFAGGRIGLGYQTITFSGAMSFSGYVFGIAFAYIGLEGTTYAGTNPTGPQYLVHKLGLIDTNGQCAFLPGTTLGTAATNGLCT